MATLTITNSGGVPVLKKLVADTAEKYGINPADFDRAAQIESGYDPTAKAKSSSASGIFQITKGTADKLGVNNVFSPEQNVEGAARLWKENESILTKKLGRQPTAGEIYLAHQQGPAGAAALINNPSAKAVDILGKKQVLNNGGTPNMSAGEFANKWVSKFEGTSKPVQLAGMFGAPSKDVWRDTISGGGITNVPKGRAPVTVWGGDATEADKPVTQPVGDVLKFPNVFGANLTPAQLNQLRILQQKYGLSMDQMKYIIAQMMQGKT